MTRSRHRRPGPPPKPVELTLLEGNPGKRKPPTVAPAAGKLSRLPPAPTGLGPAGRAAWKRWWEGGAAWLSKGDYDALWRAAKMVDRAAELERVIDREGFTHLNPETKRSAVHHSYNNLIGLYKTIADIERQAGLPATERSRVSARADSAGDPLDQWETGT